jgi:hypothetical protein
VTRAKRIMLPLQGAIFAGGRVGEPVRPDRDRRQGSLPGGRLRPRRQRSRASAAGRSPPTPTIGGCVAIPGRWDRIGARPNRACGLTSLQRRSCHAPAGVDPDLRTNGLRFPSIQRCAFWVETRIPYRTVREGVYVSFDNPAWINCCREAKHRWTAGNVKRRQHDPRKAELAPVQAAGAANCCYRFTCEPTGSEACRLALLKFPPFTVGEDANVRLLTSCR